MGYEYIIRLKDSDFEAFGRDPRGINTISKLLQQVPCYQRMVKPNHFLYSTDAKREDGWCSSIVIDGNNLMLCSYASDDTRDIVQFLLFNLLDICGRFEIEDA
jgi:hypothetical protein